MSDLISRDDLKKALSELPDDNPSYYYPRYLLERQKVFELIDNAPSVAKDYDTGYQDGLEDGLNDIRPQGEWIEDSGNIACSHCHTIWLYRKTDFCPNCGADMKGDNNDNN